MSGDLRNAVKEAAPKPRLQLDERDLARRARHITVTRVLSAIVAVFLVGTGAWSLVSNRPSPPAEVASHGDSAPEIPEGPRYEVVSGQFGEDWREEYAGKRWRLLAWGEGHTRCWQLAVEDEGHNMSLACSAPSAETAEIDHLGGSLSFFTGSNKPDEFWFAVGEVGPEVAALEFRPQGEDTIEIPLHDAPSETGLVVRFYAVTLPRFDYATLVALDEEGEVLSSNDICGPGCDEDRQEESEAKVADFEAQPVNIESKAAAFANMAVGHASLMNPFGTSYEYEGLQPRSGGFAALFEVSDCSPPYDEEGTHTCGDVTASATTVVEVEGNRFVVREANGPMTEGQRERLLSYTHPLESFSPMWRQIAGDIIREQDQFDWAVEYSLVWMGNLPPPVDDYGSLCTMTVFDGEGELVYRGRAVPTEVRREETYRVASPLTWLDRDVKDPQRVAVECDDPRADLMSDQ